MNMNMKMAMGGGGLGRRRRRTIQPKFESDEKFSQNNISYEDNGTNSFASLYFEIARRKMLENPICMNE